MIDIDAAVLQSEKHQAQRTLTNAISQLKHRSTNPYPKTGRRWARGVLAPKTKDKGTTTEAPKTKDKGMMTEAPTTEAPEIKDKGTDTTTEAPTTEAPKIKDKGTDEAPTTEAPKIKGTDEAPTTEAPNITAASSQGSGASRGGLQIYCKFIEISINLQLVNCL